MLFMVLALVACAVSGSLRASTLTYNTDGTVAGYSLPGINPAGQPNFENGVVVDWNSKLKTKHGVTSGKASLTAKFDIDSGLFLFNLNPTDSYTTNNGKFTLKADFIYDDALGEFVLDLAKGKNSAQITGGLVIPSLGIDLTGNLFTADLDSWNYSADLIGFNTTITGGLICSVLACTTHESVYLALAAGGFDPNFSMKNALGTAVSTIPLPATLWLLGSGLVSLIGIARRRS